ncbi:MAG: hypothetical protein NT003_01375, partial [Candidatus Magasanikbacteria bacterium]|nr:hypothetical protein [Candidatus Magasanikbacteria bacterium]
MIELIPDFLVQSLEEFETRARIVESLDPIAHIVHIDVLDGSWIPEKESWADAAAIGNAMTPLTFELHLIVANPIEHLDAWFDVPAVKRVFFHLETATQPKQVIEAIRFHGWEVGVAINPETPASAVAEIAHYVDEIMCMTVKTGASGRPFEHDVLKKIEELA